MEGNTVSHILDFEVIGSQFGVVNGQDESSVSTGGIADLGEQNKQS